MAGEAFAFLLNVVCLNFDWKYGNLSDNTIRCIRWQYGSPWKKFSTSLFSLQMVQGKFWFYCDILHTICHIQNFKLHLNMTIIVFIEIILPQKFGTPYTLDPLFSRRPQGYFMNFKDISSQFYSYFGHLTYVNDIYVITIIQTLFKSQEIFSQLGICF